LIDEIAVLADTQILIWYVTSPDRLSPLALEALEQATSSGRPIGVLAFAIVEMVYAAEKLSNPFTVADLDAVLDVLADPQSPFEVVPLDAGIAERMRSVPRDRNADPGDRLMVAAAEALGVPLVSSDSKIASMTSATIIW
jgi:PIN domain nuclease of toxin-antitoxin system